MKQLIYCLLVLMCLSCSSSPNKTVIDNNPFSYAKGFEIRSYPGFRSIIVNNPWQKSNGEKFTCILSDNPGTIPDSLSSFTIIKTPVERVIVFSTTHVGFISALGKSTSIVGVSGKDFICDSTVQSSIERNSCLDIGFAPNIDFENILKLKPDLVFLYGLDPSVTGLVKRLGDAGIKSVMVSEFLEDHPLGKAEWIRFFASFFNRESIGDSIFRKVAGNYMSLKDTISMQIKKPSVLVGLPWKDTWYMAGGRSFTARFIEDAGGEYLWKENENTDYIPLDLESVFQKAVAADIWINTGSAQCKVEILAVDPRIQYIPVFQHGNIFNNNNRLNKNGGNDFWESGTVRPDLVLKDLIGIFHPGKTSSDSYYYRKVE